jgi:hypothetical protein
MYAIVNRRSGSGSMSNFYKLKNTKGRGFKTFVSYDDAIVAHENQKALAEHDLAPAVYSEVGKVRIGNSKTLSRWGYITEIAETIGCGGNSCYCCDRDNLEDVYYDKIVQLLDDMEQVGFEFHDSHIGNVGYVNRGGVRLMVCIDTGQESVVRNE